MRNMEEPVATHAEASWTAFVFMGTVLSAIAYVTYKSLFRQDSQTSWLVGLLKILGASTRRVHAVLHELLRKSFHFSGLIVPSTYYTGLTLGYWTKRDVCLFVGAITVVYLFLDTLRLHWEPFNTFLFNNFSRIMRRNEVRTYTGIGYYWLGMFFSILLFVPIVSCVSLCALIFGDFSAALVGKAVGRTKLVGKKSLEGSLGCLVSCVLSALVIFRYGVPSLTFSSALVLSFVGGLMGTLAELFSLNINDNLSIPLSCGTMVTVVAHVMEWRQLLDTL